jgi:hypothetical protein
MKSVLAILSLVALSAAIALPAPPKTEAAAAPAASVNDAANNGAKAGYSHYHCPQRGGMLISLVPQGLEAADNAALAVALAEAGDGKSSLPNRT